MCAPVWSLQPEGCNYFLALSESSLCCSACIHMVKDTVVLTSWARIIIPSWQILPLTWSGTVRPRSHLCLLLWGGSAGHSTLSVCVTIEAGIHARVKGREGKKIFLFQLCSQCPQFNKLLGMCSSHGDLWASQCRCGWWHDFQDHCRTGGMS